MYECKYTFVKLNPSLRCKVIGRAAYLADWDALHEGVQISHVLNRLNGILFTHEGGIKAQRKNNDFYLKIFFSSLRKKKLWYKKRKEICASRERALNLKLQEISEIF